jgi:hypothetical protein
VRRFEAVWNEIVLLDFWGKLPAPGAVLADITRGGNR